jgi:tRNA(Ile)-lysidine synthase
MIDFTPLNNQEAIAVGLSGGGDSMALTHMLCMWARDNDRQIHILHVDHGLRAESVDEAAQIQEWVKDFPNTTFQILKWEHDNPDTAIMEKARNARYELMTGYCEVNNIQTLCIAHHADDQIETFFFRLAKGSGLDGLTGMKPWVNYNDHVKIHRPLLSASHDDLIEYCQNNHLNWIEDPSNKDENYARPRLRKSLQKEGFKVERFVKTLDRLSRAQDALDGIANDIWNKQNKINWVELKSHPIDIQIRVLQKMIAHVGQTSRDYPPKLERVEDIANTLRPNTSATLHGCLITLSKDGEILHIKPHENIR